MSDDWDEIRRLASDLQKVQLSSTLQRLSERNCVEVVNLLIKKNLISVIFTNDGKEYITPDYLRKEVEDEMYVHGGRVNLVELAQILNVDLAHINNIADKLSKERTDIHCVLGQLLDENYVQKIAAEINEKLAQDGEISVSDLTVQFDLPSEFLLVHVMEKYLGKIIRGRQDPSDPRIFFTQSYISRCKAKIRGALTGLTRPTSVQHILQQIAVQERLFHSVIHEINPAGVVTSKQQGAQYIPNAYTKNQTDWVDSFYRQNGYLEYDAVARLGLSDPKGFIKRQLPTEGLTFLEKCCIGSRIIDHIDSALEECISSGTYLDASTILPSIMSEEDIEQLLLKVLTPSKQKSTLLFGSTILSTAFVDNLLKPCFEQATENAKASVESGQYQQYFAEKQMSSNKGADLEANDTKVDKKDERRRKATGGKGGGGTQGRETKTKSTKKHYRTNDKGHQSDSEDDVVVSGRKKDTVMLELISVRDIEKRIAKELEKEGLDELATSLAKHYHPSLQRSALESAHGLYEASLQNSTQNRRQTHAALQDKINALLVDIRLYEKGLKLLPADCQSQLAKYLLKSIGSDAANEIFLYAASEFNLNYSEPTLTAEQRTKIITDCSQEYKSTFTALNKAINGTSIEDFLTAAENAMQTCSMILKKVDKKKDRTLILCHKHELLNQLDNCYEPALCLHLTALTIFTIVTQNMLHASGKYVSSILRFLQPYLNPEQGDVLRNYHDLVLKLLTLPPDSDDVKDVTSQLDEKLSAVKEIAKTFKKPGATPAE